MNYLWIVPLGFVLFEAVTDSAYNEFSTNNTKSTFKGKSEVYLTLDPVYKWPRGYCWKAIKTKQA